MSFCVMPLYLLFIYIYIGECVCVCVRILPGIIHTQSLDKDDEVHDEFYEQLQVTLESIKRSDYLVVMGDFNAILGNEKVPCVTGAHGTGIRNKSGQRLLEFCSANDLFVTNTGFRHHLRRKTT